MMVTLGLPRFRGQVSGLHRVSVRVLMNCCSESIGLKGPPFASKDDALATTQATITNVAGVMAFSGGSGLIQTTSG